MSGERTSIENLIQIVSHRLVGLLPTDWASDLGSFAIRRNVRRNRPEIIAGASRNLRIHRPDASDAQIDAFSPIVQAQ